MGLPIVLPPLRDRENDILLLSKHFADEFAKENNLGTIQFSKEAKDKLMSHPFPGNVRELKAVIDLAVVMSEDNEIREEDITFSQGKRDDLFITENKTLRQYTCDIVKQYLKKHQNDVVAAAHALDIGKSTIYKMMQAGELD